MDNPGTNRLQRVLFDMLQDVVTVCDNNGIPYYLVEGSCLGAIRHGGFIPWDDDVDIAIPVSAVDNFVAACQLELGSRYFVLPPFKDDSGELLRVFDTQVDITGGLTEGLDSLHPWIDVFLLCGMPSSLVRRTLHYYRITIRHKWYKFRNPSRILTRERSLFANAVIGLSKGLSSIRLSSNSPERQLSALRKAMAAYDFDVSDYYFCITWYGKKEIIPAHVYGRGRVVPFEDGTARVPEKAEDYLTRLYGNYAQLPPADQREGKHHLVLVE